MPRRRVPDPDVSILPRRDFLKAAGLGAGALIAGSTTALEAEAAPKRRTFPSVTPPSFRVIVIGAGAFGGWTSYHLRHLGAHVTMVDAYGPANSRATSGDESRGVRSSYGDKAAPVGELWSAWAREAMHRWPAFDREWGHDLKSQMFWKTGDVFLRPDWQPDIKRTREIWDKAKVPHEVLTPDECRYRWPQINIDNITAILYEPDAGVVRARRGAQAVASVVTHALGVKLIIAHARPTDPVNGRMNELALINGDKLRADAYVFACGPWLPKVFPDLLGNKFRLPLGQVVYYGTPPSSDAFTFPNMPSFNFPGVTGWVALPEDSRGFRVRGTESGPRPAPAATDTTGRGGRGAAAGATPGAATDSGRGAGQRGAAPADSTGRGGGRGGAGAATRPPADPAQQDPDLSTRWFDIATQARQREFVNHRFPGMKDAPVVATHACHYETTSSRNFIIDVHPQMSNVWIAGGGNAEAYKSGPVIGEYVARRVTGHPGDPAIATQFKIPKDGYPAPGTPADSASRAGRGGQPIPARTGGGYDEFEDEEY
ncbi:MAG TPA: FAD-dependent oxidoreductase [Gemmatimonadales bacterium]|jgi:glycine/D-amino acid oxidase-like deaminating enzyme